MTPLLRVTDRYTPGGGVGPAPGPGTSTIKTVWSQTLNDSFGVNVHLPKANTAYATWTAPRTSAADQVAWAVGFLGATHVRDVLHVGNGTQRSMLKAVYNATGATVLFCSWNLLDGGGYPTGNAIATDILDNYTANGQLIVDAVSGMNESDISHYAGQVAATVTMQNQLWASALNGVVTILGPSIGNDNSDYTDYGDLSGVCDLGDLHTYPGGWKPSNRISVHYTRSRNMYGASKHVWTTEGGYENATAYRGGNPPVPENVSQYYVPREILENFIFPGIDRFYIYELVDEKPNAALTLKELHFGQFRNNWTPKPQAVATGRLMRLTADPGATYTPTDIPGSVTGTDSSTRVLNLQKRDGTNLLHIWRDVPLGTPSTSAAFKPVAVSPITVTVNLPAARTVQHFEPSTGTGTGDVTPTPVRSTSGTAHQVPIGGGVTVLQFAS